MSIEHIHRKKAKSTQQHVDNFKLCTRASHHTTPYQGSKKTLGIFMCSQCRAYWRSNESWAGTGETCRCGRYVYPFKQLPLDTCDQKPPLPNSQDRFAQEKIDSNCLRINWNGLKTAGYVGEWEHDANDEDFDETDEDSDMDEDDDTDEDQDIGSEYEDLVNNSEENNMSEAIGCHRKYSGQRLVIPPSISSQKLKTSSI